LAEWSWPYTAIRGAAAGPRLALISGVHPAEYPAIEANIRLARSLDPARLRGSVVALPLIDVPAFLPRSPFVCPIDGKNPNRFFPGNPEGTFTEVMNDAIFRAVIQPADYLVDLHGGDMVEALIPFSIYSIVGTEEVNRASAAIGRAFGLPYLIASSPRPGGIGGTTVQAAAAAGVPGIIAEAGGCGLLTEPETQLLVEGVENVLRHLGILEGEVRPHRPVEVDRFTWLYSPAEGMWYPAVAVGEHVAEGQAIGRIGDLFGETLAEVRAPHGGDVLFVTSSPAMRAEGILLAIAER
jgi:predicted deacylase